MNKIEKMVFTAMMVSLAVVVAIIMKAIPLMRMENGGSVSLAMLPIFIIGFSLGPKYGFIGALSYAAINFLSDGYAFHWASLVFDYILAYGILGMSGFFSKYALRGHKIINYIFFALGMIIPSLLRLLFHTLSGILAFNTPFVGSLLYSGPYVLISLALCLVVGFIIYPFLEKYLYKKCQ